MQLGFGVFDHLDRSDLPLRDFYEQRLKVIEAFDRAGFYAYHVAEHHFTPLGMAPSPSVFLSAVGQRTRRLRFGTFVYALPVHHPLRVLEEICMLDHLSGGRLEIGFGRGSVSFEVSYYGQNAEERQQIYAERLELILKALTVRTLTGTDAMTGLTMCRWSLRLCRSRIRPYGTACIPPTAPNAPRARD